MALGNDGARYTCNIAKLLPGDILLSRVPMDLENDSTWDSHLIQALTRSCFSFSALCVGDGLFIEAVGSGVARLPIWKAGICDIRNIRVLRARKDYKWAANRAAACGLGYLERGFYRMGMPKPKCTAFQDVRRAAAANSDIVTSAYLEAGLTLDAIQPSRTVFPGGFADSEFFEDVTQHVLQSYNTPKRIAFNLDDDTLWDRIHHWEVETQLKVLCKSEIRRILEIKSARPSSMNELESLIAKNHWRSLDAALHHSLQWYRYEKIYQAKQEQLFSAISAAARDGNRTDSDSLNLIEMELDYCRKQQFRYQGLISAYKGSSFIYMYEMFENQVKNLTRFMSLLSENSADEDYFDNVIAESNFIGRGKGAVRDVFQTTL